ncbi:U4/U6.U5 tri-snRNP-associated protein 1-like [Tachypleus tridentatus]|uniref:U4/U6.U5 tri-snRNP-associated protein 1-like n=1 Tax=Tachypleus tridentatus TaxID=6853 RepID=UPI003FD603CE
MLKKLLATSATSFNARVQGKIKWISVQKKLEQEAKLRQMSSTDTPLNTVNLMQEKQKELQSPYLILSGGNKALSLTQTTIIKPK